MNAKVLEQIKDSDSGESYMAILEDKNRQVARIYEIAEAMAEDIDPWKTYPPDKEVCNVTGGVARVIYRNARSLVVIMNMREAGLFREHVHRSADMMIAVLDGTVRLRQKSKARLMHTGDCTRIPAGCLHGTSWKARTDVLMSFVRAGREC